MGGQLIDDGCAGEEGLSRIQLRAQLANPTADERGESLPMGTSESDFGVFGERRGLEMAEKNGNRHALDQFHVPGYCV